MLNGDAECHYVSIFQSRRLWLLVFFKHGESPKSKHRSRRLNTIGHFEERASMQGSPGPLHHLFMLIKHHLLLLFQLIAHSTDWNHHEPCVTGSWYHFLLIQDRTGWPCSHTTIDWQLRKPVSPAQAHYKHSHEDFQADPLILAINLNDG